MRRFECVCGGALFFENTKCLRCARRVGFCPTCHGVSPYDDDTSAPGGFGCLKCRSSVRPCGNFTVGPDEPVCNWLVGVEDATAGHGGATLCRACALTRVIPDMNYVGNRERWLALEAAKRRVLWTIDALGLPTRIDRLGLELQFEFKGDPVDKDGWTMIGTGQQIFTGHHGGTVTINIREANPVERERQRVEMKEPRRTLIGHFQHELGHFYQLLLISPDHAGRFVDTFGEGDLAGYEAAKRRYYARGPAPDWEGSFVSGYATMHPTEDFAETFRAYVEIVSVLETAADFGLIEPVDRAAGIAPMAAEYGRLGLALNEVNRELGLLDPVPTPFIGPVVDKLAVVHELINEHTSLEGLAEGDGAGEATSRPRAAISPPA